jgi:hypothetical protein
MFPDESTFQRISMNHSDSDDASAAKEAMVYLQASMYKDKLPSAGLYWEQLADRGKALKALNTPKLGDSLLKADETPWMADLARSAPKIDWDDLTQIPALPLGSWLKTDPWDDKVHMLNAKQYAPMTARDKMPFEVTPVYFKLQRYEDANVNPSAAPGAPAQPAAPQTTQPGTDQPPAAQQPPAATAPGQQ